MDIAGLVFKLPTIKTFTLTVPNSKQKQSLKLIKTWFVGSKVSRQMKSTINVKIMYCIKYPYSTVHFLSRGTFTTQKS